MTGTFGLFFHLLGIIIPIDFHIFQRGSNHQPGNRRKPPICVTLGTITPHLGQVSLGRRPKFDSFQESLAWARPMLCQPVQCPDANHGAGIFSYKTGSFLWYMLIDIPAPWNRPGYVNKLWIFSGRFINDRGLKNHS